MSSRAGVGVQRHNNIWLNVFGSSLFHSTVLCYIQKDLNDYLISQVHVAEMLPTITSKWGQQIRAGCVCVSLLRSADQNPNTHTQESADWRNEAIKFFGFRHLHWTVRWFKMWVSHTVIHKQEQVVLLGDTDSHNQNNLKLIFISVLCCITHLEVMLPNHLYPT